MTDNELVSLGFCEAADALARGGTTSRALVEALFRRADEIEPRLNAFTWQIGRAHV